ncbi:MAG TPA: GNAT family N-acetyltransferase [Anaerolineae bacterium]|nr:GNAT family N-acetyltransferase [Anaerolineae bacterium]
MMAHKTCTLVPASALTPEALTALINQAYTGYYTPVHVTPRQLSEMCQEEAIDLQQSVVALSGQIPVGLAFLSIRENQGWLSGVGVCPEWRRQGIARQIIQHLQNTARAGGLQCLWLEMLMQNTAGAALYNGLGFAHVRELLVLMAEAQPLATNGYSSQIHYAAAGALLEYYPSFHDVRPPWQRALPSLKDGLDTLHGIGYWEGAQLAGYALYQMGEGDYLLYDLAVAPAHPQRVAVAQALLLALHAAHPSLSSYIINVPVEDPLASAFLNLNYRIWHRQYEMCWQVK